MANSLFKQTLQGRPELADVQAAIGQHGGLLVRVDQTDASTTAYFEADPQAVEAFNEAGHDIQETSLEEVTRI